MTHNFRFPLLTLTIIFSTLCPNALFAQPNALKITPFKPLLGKLSLSYEYVVEPKTTIVVEYQRWLGQRQANMGKFSVGLFASSTETNTNKGYRMIFLARSYTKTALNGLFIEGGFYVGKHNIVTEIETSILLPDPEFFYLPMYQTTIEQKEYKDVRVAGLKVGGGWQKSAGIWTFECSGGLNLNAFNNKNARPTLGMKPVSPYGSIALGVKF